MSVYLDVTNGIGNNGINTNLFPFQVSDKLFQEWVSVTPLYNFIGMDPSKPIMMGSMEPGKGARWSVAKINAIDYKNPIKNWDQREGNEQQQSVDYDFVDGDVSTFQAIIRNWDILKYATPIDLTAVAHSQLVEAFSLNLNYSLFGAMTSNLYPALTSGALSTGNVAGNFPSFDRVVFKIANGTHLARGAYQANGTFATLVNGMSTSANTTPATSGLSAQHLRRLKEYAERGNASDINPNTECLIRPATIKTRSGFPVKKYIYLAHPQSINSLLADPLFANSTFNRGYVIDPANTPETLSGSDYVGEFSGIYIYSCPDLYNYQITSQDTTKTAAWNIFMGAGSMYLRWAEKPRFGIDKKERDISAVYYGHDFRGQKTLRFNSRYGNSVGAVAGSNPLIEQGIIHSFVSI